MNNQTVFTVETDGKQLMLDLLREALHAFQAQTGMIAVSIPEEPESLCVVAEIGLFQSLGKDATLPASRGVSGYVLRTGKKLIIDDENEPPLELNYVRTRDQCSICLPLAEASGKTLGLITLNKQTGTFSSGQLPFMNLIARVIGVIVKEMQLKRERERTIETLNTISAQFQNMNCDNIPEIAYQGILSIAVSATRAWRGLLLDNPGKRYSILAMHSWKDGENDVILPKDIATQLASAVEAKSPILVPQNMNHVFGVFSGGTIIVYPLLCSVTGRNWGFLVLHLKVPPDDIVYTVLRIITNLSTSLLENIHLFFRNQRLTAKQERTQIARELHDGLNQNLVALRMQVEYYQHLDEQGDEQKEPSRMFLRTIHETLDECIVESRSILKRLREASEIDIPLKEFIKNKVKTIFPDRYIGYTLKYSLIDDELPPLLKTTILKVLQECLVNAGKHAQAKRLVIKICRLGNKIFLLVKDDGKGFDPGIVKNFKPCYGLRGMEERVKLVRGVVRICSYPKRGTVVIIGIPINE